MMSPGMAQPKIPNPEVHWNTGRDSAYGRLKDPLQAVELKKRDDRLYKATKGLQDEHGLTWEQAMAMAREYESYHADGKPPTVNAPGIEYKWKKGLTPEQVSKRDLVMKHWEDDPVGPRLPGPVRGPEDRIRDLIPGKLEPYIKQCLSPTDCRMVPNPEWGKQHGMLWDGERWVSDDPRKGSAHDMDMEMRRLEMERIRQQMAMEQKMAEMQMQQMQGETGIAGGLKGWLAKRLGGG